MSDFVLEYLRKHNIPVTRENYIALAFLGDKRGEDLLPAEEESELPESLQHPDFKQEED